MESYLGKTDLEALKEGNSFALADAREEIRQLRTFLLAEAGGVSWDRAALRLGLTTAAAGPEAAYEAALEMQKARDNFVRRSR